MKINLPFNYQIKINKQYKTVKAILPIGCDCHPAYMLSKLQLRKESLPFDWLDVKPNLALNFVYETLQTEFNFFLKDLGRDENGKVLSQKHPEALFYHFDDLIENQNLKHKIKQRIDRFSNLFSSKQCCFIHTITSLSFQNETDFNFIKKSISNFTTILKENDELLIYLRFDETLEENKENTILLKQFVQVLPNVNLIFYIREKNKFGIWGDETKYKQLVTKLGIQTKFKNLKVKVIKRIKSK